jgi:hypothetical protein
MHRGQFEGKLDFKKIWKLYFGSKIMNLKMFMFWREKCAPEVFCQIPFHWHCLNTIENIVIINWFLLQWNVRKMQPTKDVWTTRSEISEILFELGMVIGMEKPSLVTRLFEKTTLQIWQNCKNRALEKIQKETVIFEISFHSFWKH